MTSGLLSGIVVSLFQCRFLDSLHSRVETQGNGNEGAVCIRWQTNAQEETRLCNMLSGIMHRQIVQSLW